MNEFELIEQIFSQLQNDPAFITASKAAGIEKAIGDDASVMALPAGARLVSCIDTLVQGRHFSADWDQVNDLAFQIGYKAVAVNVSDIAAMGATPHSILLALALPERLATEQWLSAFAQGLFHACKLFGVTLIGGDTTRNDTLVLSVSAQGFLSADTPAVYRSGAQVGDKVYVSGTLGDAAYALQHPDDEIGRTLVHRLHMPTPRITLGATLAKLGASAMIDISDGLYQDLGHICQQSAVAMRLNLEHLPTSQPLSTIDLSQRLIHQLTGGDDYELAFTLPAGIEPPFDNADTPVTCIGEVVTLTDDKDEADGCPQLFYQGQAVTQMQPAPFNTLPKLMGYQHFIG
ncbi:thiamine-phosphate kinase [Psychrobacter jeotgali]|uniref:thiamine-phosphate kinase n=1 Tax=Psychrobacter jeotgali TaxID=179010 RepID=UPI001919B811|nr:thiamine-phosphate kinase [Psychrobacter jeotgali]